MSQTNQAARLVAASTMMMAGACATAQLTYPVVDTGQTACFDNDSELSAAPPPGEAFCGQDAQQIGLQPWYLDNGDGTVTDLHTGLMWQKTPDYSQLRTWSEAMSYADSLSLAGFEDWRVPSIKELYSLMHFDGHTFEYIPFIDTDFFDFEYPDPVWGLRDIDCQYFTSTEYVGATMDGNATVFGVNFGDGRIKGYPKDTDVHGNEFARWVRCVRGGDGQYGVNDFVDNRDGTITDLATGLMWMKSDSGSDLNWQEALAYADSLVYAGHADWQLPDAKQLQSIIDYTRAPDAIDPSMRGPAIDPVFDVTETESYYWSSTTHLDGPLADTAIYFCFGQAWGYLGPPGLGEWTNVHGAGAQRSDPKEGDPDDYPYGRGPQGDDVRIYNYVRCVRPAGATLNISPLPIVAGADANFTVSNGSAEQKAWLVYSRKGPGATAISQLNVVIDLQNPKQIGKVKTADENGSASWTISIPSGVAGLDVWLQAVQAGRKTNVIATTVQ